jgi:drug/metabolite transporter (DMT)-like permease
MKTHNESTIAMLIGICYLVLTVTHDMNSTYSILGNMWLIAAMLNESINKSLQ